MKEGCGGTCKFRQDGQPLPELLREKMFDDFYREGASAETQVRIVITYLLNV